MDDADITAWALAARGGDRVAAEAFVRGTQTALYRLLTYLAPVSQAEDLVQETYLRAFTGLRRFQGRSPARLWLFAIARRAVADSYRSAARRPRTTPFETWHDDMAGAPAPDGSVAIRQAIAGLAVERREAFVLTQMLGLSYDEAAEVCGCAVGTIRSRVFRARADLIEQLHPEAGTEPKHQSG
jgi:RNA polymerase sigma-70 factor (ECF subfamily)